MTSPDLFSLSPNREKFPVSYTANGLQDYIAISRYARYDERKRRRETWAEGVARVREMHLGRYNDVSLIEVAKAALLAGEVTADEVAKLGPLSTLHDAITNAFAQVEAKRVLPSMRSLQFGGEAILKKHTRIYNCAFMHIDRVQGWSRFGKVSTCCCVGVGWDSPCSGNMWRVYRRWAWCRMRVILARPGWWRIRSRVGRMRCMN